MPNLFIIAGPNGSGKSTFAGEFLPKFANKCRFFNADLIALGLSPFDPVKVRLTAGKLLLSQIRESIRQKEDFAFESTLSGKSYLSLIEKAKKYGYKVHIFFLWIPDVRLAKARIKQRVQNGGHNVPVEDIERRFSRSRKNFINYYRDLCETWTIFENSKDQPVEIAYSNKGSVEIKKKTMFNLFED